MSWMDSWSRPSKSQAIPAPYYLLPGGEDTPYCHSCGRVISSRRTTAGAGAGAKSKTPAKYCSARCRGNRPGKLDRQLEETFVMFLSGQEAFEDAKKGRGKHVKGESRILVPCSVVERHVFGDDGDAPGEARPHGSKEATSDAEGEDLGEPEAGSMRVHHQNNEAFERFDDEGVAGIAVHDDTVVEPGGRRRRPDAAAGPDSSRKGDEVDDMEERRRLGQRRARHKEMARCAARRGVVFGFAVEGSGGERRRLCEAVVGGKVVEPSYAKGDWAIRWRE